MTSQQDYVKTALRVPKELHRALHDSAKLTERSFNAEIVVRLRASFQQAVMEKEVTQ